MRTPRAFSAAAIPRRLATPLSCTCPMTGATFSAKRRAASAVRAAPSACASARLVRLPSRAPCRLRAASAARALRDHPPLLLGERGVDVQHEGVHVGAELGDQEGHALHHQPGDEVGLWGAMERRM